MNGRERCYPCAVESDIKQMPVVILAGGLGTRLREETEFKPKPMVEIGDQPIIWHIMKHYSRWGFSNFIICLGYKGSIIRDYFMNHQAFGSTTKIRIGENRFEFEIVDRVEESWEVTLCDTGRDSLTGDRILKIANFIDSEDFFLTYGDGLSDVNLSRLLTYHKGHNKLATMTVVNPVSRFGALDLREDGQVRNFVEKPVAEDWINGGFFVFKKKIFSEIVPGSLEENSLPLLAARQELMAFKHAGFWQCMDTYREVLELNRLWNSGNAPWAN